LPQVKSDEVVIEVGRRTTVEDSEALASSIAARLTDRGTVRFIVKLAAQTSSDVFADVWVAIAVGMICRYLPNGATVVTWGSPTLAHEVHNSSFAQSLPGLVALQMARAVVTDGVQATIDGGQFERMVSLSQQGIVEAAGGPTRTLVEFDPQQPIALALQDRQDGGDALLNRRRLFGQLLLRFRRELEVAHVGRGIPPADAGAMKALGTFLSELHDNAYEHGRAVDREGRILRGVRYLRLRKQIGKNRDEIISRAGSFPPLRQYLEQTALGAGPQAVMEAVVSDYGPGIVDHFLQSRQGHSYQHVERRALLHRLLHESLTAKGLDPSAGLGIQRALRAAKELAGFVSLRTGEFWLAQSYNNSGGRRWSSSRTCRGNALAIFMASTDIDAQIQRCYRKQ
jgi:hypothetical protein